MNFDDIFEAYYTQYRAEAEVPASTEDEYIIGIPLANEAINRWANYDNTMWLELYSTLQLEQDGDLTIVSGQTTYATPGNFKLAGGDVVVLNANGTRADKYPFVSPEEVQFMGDLTKYAYVVGNPSAGYSVVLNPAPDATTAGLDMNYVYYKKPTKFTRGGTQKTEMSDPYFIVHRMLANRFRSSRNPYYGSAKEDAEDALRTMQLTNNSGNWSNPWSLPDRSGTSFGA